MIIRKFYSKRFLISSFFLSLFLFLLLAGCQEGGVGDEWRRGKNGVVISFSPNLPPDILYNDEEYALSLEVRNLGVTVGEDEVCEQDDEVDIDLYFTGFSPDILDIDEDYISVEGCKSDVNPEGGYAFYEQEFDVELPEGSETRLNIPLKATACYEYSTIATLLVCVDPDPSRDVDDACIVKAVSDSGGQGAPVAVTRIETESSLGKARFDITVQNIGGGQLIDIDEVDDCMNLRPINENVISDIEVRLGEDYLECSPEDRVRLPNGRGRISCVADDLDDETSGSYAVPITITFYYGYKNSVTRSVEIRPSILE